jgi:hypothetical protein
LSKQVLSAHIFTDAPAAFFIKQFPNAKPELGGFRFSFGLDVPSDIDVLIIFNRASYAVATDLPITKTAFIAAEPEAIHPYSCRFLNQFGIVLSATQKPLKTNQWRTSPCWYWFAGIDFSQPLSLKTLKGHDYYRTLSIPKKSEKVAVVTSNKTATPFQRGRVAFLDALINKIPQHLDVYGRGYKTIDDKGDALLQCKYHIALENCGGEDTWTEKFADSMLCWSFPFYNGCTNLGSYFPKDSFEALKINDPDQAAAQIVQAIENDTWSKSLPAIKAAREIILEEQNIAHQLVSLCGKLMATPMAPRKPRHIWSERSLWPERGCRGSVPGWLFRNMVLAFDPVAELKTASLRSKIETRRSEKRTKKLIALERGRSQ